MAQTNTSRLGLVTGDPGLLYGAIIAYGTRMWAASRGVDLVTLTATSTAEQVQLIDRLVQQRIDALIVEPVESRGIASAIQAANAAGIPVVAIDGEIWGSSVVCTVRPDHHAGAALAVTHLIRHLGGRGTLAHLQGALAAQTGRDRSLGLHSVLAQYPDVQLVFEAEGDWTRESGASLMRAALAGNPSLQAVFAANDPMALGALDVIAEAGRAGQILVAGIDASAEALLAIRAGTMSASVRQAPIAMGRLAGEMALRSLQGATVPPLLLTDVALVTLDNLAEAMADMLDLVPGLLNDLLSWGAALGSERNMLRTLIDNLPDYIYVKDRASRFLVANSATAKRMGAETPDALLGKTDFDFYPHDLANRYYRNEQAIIQSGQPLLNQEEPAHDRADRQIWILTTKVPLRDQQGQIVGLVGIGRDITERKRLEAQLLQSQKMEIIGRLAGGVAHDFNNLLTVIAGYSNLTLDLLPPDSPGREELREIVHATDRATSLTRQLLTFARKQTIAPQVLNLNLLILNMDKLLRRLIGENITFVTLPTPNLALVNADPHQIEQVLINLAVNARDAMPDGGRLTIETANVEIGDGSWQHLNAREGSYVILAVSDTGIGMDDNVKRHLFEPFFTTKAAGLGTGLGLATSYGIIVQHEGHIEVYSEPGQGTSIKVYLPAVAGMAENHPQPDAVATLPQGTETVLLVEDSEAVRELTVQVLSRLGYTVQAYSSGDEALRAAAAATARIDLLLTDVVLPELGGKSLAERLTKTYSRLKVLFMSGYADHTIAHNNGLDATDAFLPKPFSPTMLAHKVREVLDS
jgi:PAS domain S-box-containing protein